MNPDSRTLERFAMYGEDPFANGPDVSREVYQRPRTAAHTSTKVQKARAQERRRRRARAEQRRSRR